MKSTYIASAIFAAVLVTLVILDVGAEEKGRRGHHAEFGGGMIGRLGSHGLGSHGGDPTLGLLRAEEVKKELEITPEQEEALEKLAENSRSDKRPRDGYNERRLLRKCRKIKPIALKN